MHVEVDATGKEEDGLPEEEPSLQLECSETSLKDKSGRIST